jgi:hypothetical protein
MGINGVSGSIRKREGGMPTVSDYVVVTDDFHPLRTDGGDREHTFNFGVPSNVNTSQPAVATWQFEAEGPPQNLEWQLSVNGKVLVDFTHHINRFAAVQEVFPGSVLQAGSGNKATVKITGGTGVIKFSDFVIHMKVNVESATPPAGSVPPPGGGGG